MRPLLLRDGATAFVVLSCLLTCGCQSDVGAADAGGTDAGDMGAGVTDAGVTHAGDAGTTPAVFQSGSRLRASFMMVGSARQFAGWFDRKLGVRCSFRLAEDRAWRCLPTTQVGTGYFGDATCMAPAVVGTCGNAYASSPLSRAGCSSGASRKALRTPSRVRLAGARNERGRSARGSNPSCTSSWS